MFDRAKERIAKLEEDHESIRKAKQHVVKYQVVYAAVGGSAMTIVAVRMFGGPQVLVKDGGALPAVINNTVAPVIAPVINNNNIGNQLVNNAGHCCKIVQDLDNPEKLWAKASLLAAELAEEHGITFERARWLVSRHTNGAEGYETLFGKKYVNYGVSTTG